MGSFCMEMEINPPLLGTYIETDGPFRITIALLMPKLGGLMIRPCED
jgi:hypothetical protein